MAQIILYLGCVNANKKADFNLFIVFAHAIILIACNIISVTLFAFAL